MIVNGEEVTIADGTTVAAFLSSRGHDISRSAVLLNGKVVPRAKLESTALSNSDRMEIVSFVGGG
ncbi:MAG: sulfur carrier protein ThiS [archaeon]|nr:sulfur carrier protein ThiS [archaeon]